NPTSECFVECASSATRVAGHPQSVAENDCLRVAIHAHYPSAKHFFFVFLDWPSEISPFRVNPAEEVAASLFARAQNSLSSFGYLPRVDWVQCGRKPITQKSYL